MYKTVYSVTSLKAAYVGCVCVCVCVCVTEAVTCHLHFWQNDWNLLHAIAVTTGWNGSRNESAQNVDHREENIPPLLPGLETATFQSRVRRTTAELYPSPYHMVDYKSNTIHYYYYYYYCCYYYCTFIMRSSTPRAPT